MKHITAVICLFFSAATVFGQINLFEKQNLSDWVFHTDKDGVTVGDVYSFSSDGILSCKGLPMGWLGTKKEYKNFHLSVEYRWKEGAEPSNTGVFMRINAQSKSTFLPRCYEIQLCHEKNGDIMGLHDMKISPPDANKHRFTERRPGDHTGKINGITKILNAEKKPGEWNSLEILCVEDLIVVVLNGKLVNWTTGVQVCAGKIAFQAEGGPCEFRNAVLEPDKF
jgi:hypothetical protein